MTLKRFAMCGIAALLSGSPVAAAGLDSRMADAAEAGNAAALRSLLNQHAPVNAPQADGMTALHWAVRHDDVETAQALIRGGADVKATNRYGVPPLSLACTNGDARMVELLLSSGADPNTALPGGETALMTCSRTGKVDAVKALLARGAEVNAKDTEHGQTALMWAAAEGNVETVQALVAAGGDIHARLASGFTPLLFAVREGRIGVVKALVKDGADVKEKLEPAIVAAKIGEPARIRSDDSALALAVANAHYELASYLLDAGADPNVKSNGGATPLHIITNVRKSGMGDNDPAPQGSGNMSSLEIIKKLVAKGADVNARITGRARGVGHTQLNLRGATPFFLASRTADFEMMRLLVSLGADPAIPNADNSTPLIAAAGLGTASPGEDAGTEPEVLEAVAYLLKLGADVNAVDNNGETAMHGAAYKNLPQVVTYLSEHGARIDVWNKKNKHGWTPYEIATGYRFGNFKPSAVTIAALESIMKTAGVQPVVNIDLASRTRPAE
jgi:ankyrin repeat protein